MGKNRRSNSSGNTSEPVPAPHEIVRKLKDWQQFGNVMYHAPEEKMNEDEIQYVKDHMESSDNDPEIPTGHLTRVEKAKHFLELGLKEGDLLDTKSVFRAFSREPDSTNNYMLDTFKKSEPLVIYRTNGNVLHYNLTNQTGEFPHEKESWIETGKLRIDKITHYTEKDSDMKKVIIDNLDLKNYPNSEHMYSQEYIDEWDFDPTPRDIMIVDVSQA